MKQAGGLRSLAFVPLVLAAISIPLALGMESGGRRIKRSVAIDQNSIRFLDRDGIASLRRFALLDDYLSRKREEIDLWNEKLAKAGRDPVNERRVTNIGTFRAYVFAYLRAHPRIAQHLTLLVRQLDPTPQGLPLEIYCFTATTSWSDYEDIQADIFDHILSVVPLFGLRLFQTPSGLDLARMGGPTEERKASLAA